MYILIKMTEVCSCIACEKYGNCCGINFYPDFLCSISNKLMFDPVVAPDRKTYERSEILKRGIQEDKLIANNSLKISTRNICANSKQKECYVEYHDDAEDSMGNSKWIRKQVFYACTCLRCVYMSELNRRMYHINPSNEYQTLIRLFRSKIISNEKLVEVISETSDCVINYIDNCDPRTLLICACEECLTEVALVLFPRMFPKNLLVHNSLYVNALEICCSRSLNNLAITLINTNMYNSYLLNSLYYAIKNHLTDVAHVLLGKIKRLDKNTKIYHTNLFEFAKENNMTEVVNAFK